MVAQSPRTIIINEKRHNDNDFKLLCPTRKQAATPDAPLPYGVLPTGDRLPRAGASNSPTRYPPPTSRQTVP